MTKQESHHFRHGSIKVASGTRNRCNDTLKGDVLEILNTGMLSQPNSII